MSPTHNEAPRSGYQGSHVNLRVNRIAAAELADVLRDAACDPSREPVRRDQLLTLPDGRELKLSVQVTDDGAVYNEHGEWRDDDGRAHADVSGDFAVHVAASEVMEAASSLYYDHPSPERAAETDERRIRWKLNQHLPELPGDEARQVQRERVYRQAMAAADATRDERLDFVDRYARERLANDRAGQRTAEQGAGREAADGAGRDAGRGWSM